VRIATDRLEAAIQPEVLSDSGVSGPGPVGVGTPTAAAAVYLLPFSRYSQLFVETRRF